jgi:signal transduction histidine kinase
MVRREREHAVDDEADSGRRSTQLGSPAAALAWSRGMRLESLGNLAHELRTPVQVLIGYLDLLREDLGGGGDEETREIVERMNANVHELAQTIDNLMEHALAAADAAMPNIVEEVKVQSLVADIKPVLDAANSRKHLRLSFDLAGAPDTIRAPRRALHSILANLALNAIKFTDAGSVTIAVRQLIGADRDEVEIEVSDTGPGMTQAMFANALAPFSQLSAGTGRRHRGLGLGLSVTQRNALALDGRLELDSAPGGGARLLVRFPIVHRPPPQIPVTRKTRGGRLSIPSPLPGPPRPGKRAPGSSV